MHNSTTLPLDTPDLPVLASIGDASYHELALVVRREAGRSSLYCLRRDWESMPAGQLAQRDSTIAALQLIVQELGKRVAELETAAENAERRTQNAEQDSVNLGESVPGSAVCVPRSIRLSPLAHADAARAHIAPAAGEPLVCSDCGEAKPLDDYYTHMRKDGAIVPAYRYCKACHTLRRAATRKRALESAPDAPWSCADCGADAFAPSLADPRRCMRCAAKGNGHLVEA